MWGFGDLIPNGNVNALPIQSLVIDRQMARKSNYKSGSVGQVVMPVTITTAHSLAVFQQRLKTYLFTKAYMV